MVRTVSFSLPMLRAFEYSLDVSIFANMVLPSKGIERSQGTGYTVNSGVHDGGEYGYG
jgi:hypothetical protein